MPLSAIKLYRADPVTPVYQNSKQLKLIPFPNYATDDDVAMSEAEPLYPDTHHTRIPSNVSSTSSNASDSPITGSRKYLVIHTADV